MVYATALTSSGLITRTCSGSCFAPRVVLTAAHCLSDIYEGQLFVYYGDDFEGDFEQLVPWGDLLMIPEPGQPSTWAQADSFETHPEWDPNLLYPDMGVIYLDRALPFEPLPLARFRLGRHWKNRPVTVSGWGANEASGPTTGTGSRIQRTGQTKILGSPTSADYHPEDPNPGMLIRSVRRNIVKTDAQPPNTNGCFGDSGGPMLASIWGQPMVAGVSYFTGLYCEDYGLYTRIDPFLPFLDEAYKKGGHEPLLPSLACVAPNASGTLTAYFGYTNRNGVSLAVPYGCRNRLDLDVNSWRPTQFLPGEHPIAFSVDFAGSETVTYTLNPENNARTTLHATSTSTQCTPDTDGQFECAASCRAALLSGCSDLPTFQSCMAECLSFVDLLSEYVPECITQNTAFNECIIEAPPGTEHWLCYDGYTPSAIDCEALAYELYTCLGF